MGARCFLADRVHGASVLASNPHARQMREAKGKHRSVSVDRATRSRGK